MRRLLGYSQLAATLGALTLAFSCAPSPRAKSASTAWPRAEGPAAPYAHGASNPGAPAGVPPPSLTIRFLDVGQGDAALLTTSDHHALLIDAGPPEAAAHVALATSGVALDAVVLSHAHADHLGDLSSLVTSLQIARWIDPGFAPHVVAAYPRALTALRARGVPIVTARRGFHFAVGAGADVVVLAPSEPLFSHTRSDVNANSVVLRIDHHAPRGDVRVLFEGDAEEPTEKRLLEDGASLRADVLKVAHHGSKHATTDALLTAVAPRLAVISCALRNDYGHPHAQALARLTAHGATLARTDLEGDVTVTSDERGLRWTTERDAAPEALRQSGGASQREAP